MFTNVRFGFCLWDVLAALVLLAVIIAFVMEGRRHKKRMKEIEEENKPGSTPPQA